MTARDSLAAHCPVGAPGAILGVTATTFFAAGLSRIAGQVATKP